MSTIIGLVDCNNFYVSCERAFRPDLEGKPVVILSNNDGCAVARSNEAKALGIGMAEPAFKIRHLVDEAGLVMLSSNYTLYGDMSARVMSVLADHVPAIEVYSIDESFLLLDGMPMTDFTPWARELRETVRRWTGIPVSIGIATTKTLAKMSNRLAKKAPKTGGVLDLASHPEWLDRALSQTEVKDLWGVGPAFTAKLTVQGIRTAKQLRDAEDGWIRKNLGNVGLRTVMELRGVAVHDLETEPEPRQSCCVSRSFGEATSSRDDVRDAVVTFAGRAAEKVRRSGLVAGVVQAFIATDRFRHGDPQHSAAVSVKLPSPTDSTPRIIEAALRALGAAWKDGFAYRKAGVILLELVAPGDVPRDLFSPPPSPKSAALMGALDATNQRFGRDTLRFGGLIAEDAGWKMHQGNKTPGYTTSWEDIPVAKLG